MPERERWMRWIAACRLDGLNVTRHTRLCSIHFEGGLGLTKLNPVPLIFAFPHLRWKPPKSRTYLKERRRKRWKETPSDLEEQESVYFQKKKRDVLIIRSKEEYSAFEGANTPYCRPVYLDAAWWRGPNWFNDLRNRSKINYNGKLVSFYRLIQKFFATLICNADCKYFFNSGGILTKLSPISLTEIVLKL